MSISDTLGQQHEVKLPQGTIRYRERGEGEPIVFVHGALVNGDLWRKVVPLLADRYRCIVPDWPLGSHSVPMAGDADLTPPGLAAVIAGFLEALDLRDATLVSNDTGTALTQLVFTEHPERVGRVVLTTGDAFENFFPKMFKPLIAVAYVPGSIWALDKLARSRVVQRQIFKSLAKDLPGDEILDSFVVPLRTPGVRHDTTKFLRAVRSRYTQEAAKKFGEVRVPVLLAWTKKDPFFPLKDARRIAELIPDARVEEIEDTRTFISEDQPERLATAIAGFVSERPLGAGEGSAQRDGARTG